MALKSDLMAAGMPPAQANKLGFEPLTSFTAAGTTQGTATTLTANLASVTTSSISAGVIIGLPNEENFISNLGPNVLTVYPPVGGTFAGQSVNVGIQVAPGSGVTTKGAGTNFSWNISGP